MAEEDIHFDSAKAANASKTLISYNSENIPGRNLTKRW